MTQLLPRSLAFVALLLLGACVKSVDFTSPIKLEVDANQTLWNSKNIRSYTMEQTRVCSCPNSDREVSLRVVNGTLVSGTDLITSAALTATQLGYYRTIDQLFSDIRANLEPKNGFAQFQYDATLGYPREFFLSTDQSTAAEDLRRRVEAVVALP